MLSVPMKEPAGDPDVKVLFERATEVIDCPEIGDAVIVLACPNGELLMPGWVVKMQTA